MKIIITGATSFIGASLIRCLMQNSENYIWAIIRPNSVNRKRIPISKNVSVIELDMLDIENVSTYIDEDVDVFFHLAWEGVRAPFRDDHRIQVKNYEAAKKAIETCRKLNIKKFIGCGSQAEYGYMNGEIKEDYPCNPLTEYGKYKYKSCCEIIEYARKYKIECIWGRVFSIYGPGDYAGSLIMTCIDKMMKNEEVALTECTQNWDYLYIDDAAEAFVKFAQTRCKSGVYNIASGETHVLKYYIENIKCILDSDSKLDYGKIPYPDTGKVSFIPDISKLKNELDWSAKTDFTKGISNIIRGKTDEKNKYCSTNL